MNEQEYKDKLKVRQQLSLSDRLKVLEYEFDKLVAVAPPDELAKMGIIRDAKKES